MFHWVTRFLLAITLSCWSLTVFAASDDGEPRYLNSAEDPNLKMNSLRSPSHTFDIPLNESIDAVESLNNEQFGQEFQVELDDETSEISPK